MTFRSLQRIQKEKKRWVGWNNQPLKTGSYQSFRNYIWWLRKLGLIEFSREELSSIPELQPRRYYKLSSKGREKPDLFCNPRRDLYPTSGKKESLRRVGSHVMYTSPENT